MAVDTLEDGLDPTNVVVAPVISRLSLPVDRILNSAKAANLESVLVIGWRQDGSPYFASSEADGPEILWLLELTKKNLFECATSESGVA